MQFCISVIIQTAFCIMSTVYSFTNNLFCFTLYYTAPVADSTASKATVGKIEGTSSGIYDNCGTFISRKYVREGVASTPKMGVVPAHRVEPPSSKLSLKVLH